MGGTVSQEEWDAIFGSIVEATKYAMNSVAKETVKDWFAENDDGA